MDRKVTYRLHPTPNQEAAMKNMMAGGGVRKKGLNREILARSPALFLQMLRAKAQEAGLAWLFGPHPHREAIPDLLGLRTAGAKIPGAASPCCA